MPRRRSEVIGCRPVLVAIAPLATTSAAAENKSVRRSVHARQR